MNTIDFFIQGARRLHGRAEKLTAGIESDFAARKPLGRDGVVIDCNHATFIFGHLSLYPARMLERAGLDGSAVKAPEGWEALFSAGVECRDDRDGNIYPAFSESKERFFRGSEYAFEKLASVSQDQLLVPPAEERLRASFPNLGCMLNFLLVAHVSMHLGQLSTWRRCFGLKSVE